MTNHPVPPVVPADDTAVRALVAQIADIFVTQKTPLPIALQAMGFTASILLREFANAGIDAKPGFLRALESAHGLGDTILH